MKTRFSILLGVLPFFATCLRADTIALWGFESPPFNSVVTNRVLGLGADNGNGVAAVFHNASNSTAFFAVGNGSSHSFASDHWLGGDSLIFYFSTTGYSNIQLSFDLAADPAGLTNFALFCSPSPGATRSITMRCPVNVSGNWNPVTRDSSVTASFDLSALSELNNTPTVYVELSGWGPGDPQSVVSVDNFLATGTPIPEPGYLLFVPLLALYLTSRPKGRPLL